MDSYLLSNSSALLYIFLLLYFLFMVYTIANILLDTTVSSKTLAYLLLVIVLPVFGMAFYYSFGMNTRRGKSNRRSGKINAQVSEEFASAIDDQTEQLMAHHQESLSQYSELVRFLKNLGGEGLSSNRFQLLINGEEKFPELLKMLGEAQDYIHLEYYTWENDIRGNQIKDILLQKARQGVKVRVIYDAYASRKIKNNIVKELRAGGVDIYPIIKVKLVGLANRVNHRDHRKIAIIDGIVGFVGGINLSDRYDNSIDTGLYWRDTHVKITGPGVMNLLRHFMVSWRACQSEELDLQKVLPRRKLITSDKDEKGLSQIISGGPIYSKSNIMLSYTRLFTLARQKLYITNPYFIPNETIMNALCQAAITGVDVRLMIPEKSDSAIVGAASKFYFTELLNAGVRIFLYKKGFVHAKTVVADSRVSVVGTANMDIRSFDLNFEIMSIIYGTEFAKKMEDIFQADLAECIEVSNEEWQKKKSGQRLIYAIARLISSFL